MPPTLENPFTPKSAIPTKRLFGGEEKVVKRKLSKEAEERIKEAKEKFVQYGNHNIFKDQAMFLFAIEKEIIEHAKKADIEWSVADVRKKLTDKITSGEGNIQSLDLRELHLKFLPSLNKLVNLRELLCSFNNLVTLPNLDKLVNLSILNCQNNQLTSLPSLDKLVALQDFDCKNNELTSLPSLDKLVNLQALICDYNNLKSLPNLDKLVKLRVLAVSHNQLSSLHDLDKLINLVFLNCKDNNFSEQEESKIKSQIPKNCNIDI